MTDTIDRPEGARRSADAEALERITLLATRARSGEISQASALSRIAALARAAQTGETYQKPWG